MNEYTFGLFMFADMFVCFVFLFFIIPLFYIYNLFIYLIICNVLMYDLLEVVFRSGINRDLRFDMIVFDFIIL